MYNMCVVCWNVPGFIPFLVHFRVLFRGGAPITVEQWGNNNVIVQTTHVVRDLRRRRLFEYKQTNT